MDQDDIQKAIQLHEQGGSEYSKATAGSLDKLSLADLAQSTAMFGRLADPDGENNALSQVLYGLALR